MEPLRVDSAFASRLPEAQARIIADSEDSIFVLDEELAIRACNAAYLRFGETNGCTGIESRFGLGCRLTQVLPHAVCDIYLPIYLKALESGARVDHDYECSSPQVFRRYHQTVYPLRERRGLIVSNHLVYEVPHSWKASAKKPGHFDADGWLSQCACCRKVKDRSRPENWDWVPAFVESPHPRTTHTYCLTCLDFYYGHLLDDCVPRVF